MDTLNTVALVVIAGCIALLGLAIFGGVLWYVVTRATAKPMSWDEVGCLVVVGIVGLFILGAASRMLAPVTFPAWTPWMFIAVSFATSIVCFGVILYRAHYHGDEPIDKAAIVIYLVGYVSLALALNLLYAACTPD